VTPPPVTTPTLARVFSVWRSLAKKKAAKKISTPNPCLGAEIITATQPVEWFGTHLPFTPSNKQLIGYAKHFGHKCVVNYQNDPPSVTFDEDALRVMMKRYPKDPLYPLIAEYRELEKCLGTYVDGIQEDLDGRYREIFKHNPKTLRLAMRVLQLLPRFNKDEPESLYNEVRGMFVAGPGKILLERDFSGIEAVMVMYLANDPVGYRLSAIVQGMHDFVATTAVGRPPDLSWSDEDLSAYFEEFRKEDRNWKLKSGQELSYITIRYACKRAVFLSFYGGTPPRMVQAEPKVFSTTQIATFYQDIILKETFPSIERWQWKTCEEAERRKFVTAPSGFRMYYPDGVFNYNFNKKTQKWQKSLGEIAKECIAAKPQHMGMVFSAKALAAAYADPVLSDTLRLSIHDAIMTECPLERVEEADVRLQEIMERPMLCMPLPPEWKMGSHVVVKTEAKKGARWSKMK
jgi:DNA polymerase I-like protein with 3'-5' exonuclease and polymerase domains